MITIAETAAYLRDANMHLSDAERMELLVFLSKHPTRGVLVAGANGLRKLRWAKAGAGKSGGVRVVYYFHNESIPLYILALFAKNERANLSAAERETLGKLIDQLVAAHAKKRTRK
jgi:hypothetical protein